MTTIQVITLALHIGFSKKEAPIVACIAQHESSLKPKEINRANKNGTVDYGLMQINSIWRKRGQACHGLDLLDARQNMQCAHLIHAQKGFRPWVAYRKFRAKCDSQRLVKKALKDINWNTDILVWRDAEYEIKP